MNSAVFIDKNRVQHSFASAAQTYDGLASLQREVGLELFERFEMKQQDLIILDIGCGTGFLTQQVIKSSIAKQIIAVDIAFSMLQLAQTKLPSVKLVCADAERLPFQPDSVDKIVSNVALQWCQNLPQVFYNFNQILKNQGQLVFSTFGPATLKELKQAWSEVDDFSHVNDFYSAQALLEFLQRAGFKNIQIEHKIYHSNYSTVMALMKELKGIGAHNVLEGRNRSITSKGSMQKMITAYEKKRLAGMIPATYEIIFVRASVS